MCPDKESPVVDSDTVMRYPSLSALNKCDSKAMDEQKKEWLISDRAILYATQQLADSHKELVESHIKHINGLGARINVLERRVTNLAALTGVAVIAVAALLLSIWSFAR